MKKTIATVIVTLPNNKYKVVTAKHTVAICKTRYNAEEVAAFAARLCKGTIISDYGLYVPSDEVKGFRP